MGGQRPGGRGGATARPAGGAPCLPIQMRVKRGIIELSLWHHLYEQPYETATDEQRIAAEREKAERENQLETARVRAEKMLQYSRRKTKNVAENKILTKKINETSEKRYLKIRFSANCFRKVPNFIAKNLIVCYKKVFRAF